VDLHRIEVRLPPSYPASPPAIRWLTPIFHPNVSSSGYVNLKAIELTWVRELGLEIVAERLWDMARLAYRNEGLASHFQARNWIARQSQFPLPVDPRPLRDLVPQSNVIRYERGGEVLVAAPPRKPGEDILYIDEDTPAPDLSARTSPPETREGSGIWYLGDE
jgi:hypothetical protein